MSSRRRSAYRFLWVVGLSTLARPLHAQPSAAEAQAAPTGPVLEPPALRVSSEAEYPAEAAAEQLEGEVVLSLLIDAEGHVTSASVVTPGGHGFDAAALAAVQRFEFTPARKDGVAVVARILYRYQFRLPPPAAAPPPIAAVVVPPPEAAAAAAPKAALEVKVQGVSTSDRLRRSAEAVTVVDTQVARRRSADLGDVLVAIPGVNVRRDGGLGASTRFALNGLSGDQVRLFLDGIPLELAGYPFGIANVPVNLIERIEVYSGVVPIRFGADALGGAVNLVTLRPHAGTQGEASYQLGSFDTQRLTLSLRQLHEPSGVYAELSGFVDYAKNDYPINAQVSRDDGSTSEARVYRFHDKYAAESGRLELGVLDKPWAERLSLRAFVTNFYKEYQSNLIMTVPFGGLNYRDITPGVSLTYQQPLAANVRLDAVAGYTFGRGQTQDLATCTYDWFGRCTSDRDPSKQRNQLYLDHNSYARMRLEYKPHAEHTLRLALAPSYVSRDGKDRLYDGKGRDPLTADRALWGFVNGLEYQLDLFDNRLENIAFIKQYMQGLSAEEVAIGNLFRRRDRDTHRFGAGDGLRYRAIDWLWLKASYEYATRLPSPEEVFGDGILIDSNIALAPEVSHNANLGFQLDARNTSAGAFRATLNGFYRNADQLIMLLGSAAKQTFQNVYAARSTGIEAAIGWSSRGEYVAIDANFTQQSFRNRSDQGAFGSYKGDRIPSQPYLFANASVRLQFPELFAVRDQLVLFWTSRYVHSFYRGWESVGDPDTKQVIPAQLVHAAGFGYMVKNAQQRSLTFSLELQNLTDERVYDYYGSQRPGRAVYAKTTASF